MKQRMMTFIDGENLVCRYQEMIGKGWNVKRQLSVDHVPDAFVWEPSLDRFTGYQQRIRANYYTSLKGDDLAIEDLNTRIRGFGMSPFVFKRLKGQAKSKGVDIKLVVDALIHVHQNNVEIVHLMSGDGDYTPLVEEVRHRGRNIYLSAFSSGLNKSLLNIVDEFVLLDKHLFGDGPSS